MTVQSKATLKGYFNAGDQPTEAQFADLVDTVPARYFGYLVAANDAPADVKNQADYLCDNTDDHVQIQAAIDALPAAGGKIILSQGTFTLGAALTLAAGKSLIGQGCNATIITGGAAYDANLIVLATRSIVAGMKIAIPATSTNHALHGDGTGQTTLRDLWITGGNSAAVYAISLEDFFRSHLENIVINAATSGVRLINEANDLNYGNGAVVNVEVLPTIAAHTGWLISGAAMSVNLMSFSYISCICAAEFAAGSVGLHIVNSGYMTFNQLDMENSATSLLVEGAAGGGAQANGNVFCGMYLGEDVTLDAGANYNTFVGGKIFGTLTDNGTGNTVYNTQ